MFDDILKNGFDSHNFVTGIGEHFRSLLVCQDNATVQLLQVSENIKAKYAEQANKTSLSFLLSGLNIVSACDTNFKNSKNQRLHVELCLLKLASLNNAVNFAKDFSLNGDVKKKTSVSSGASGETRTPSSNQGNNINAGSSHVSATDLSSIPIGPIIIPEISTELPPEQSHSNEVYPRLDAAENAPALGLNPNGITKDNSIEQHRETSPTAINKMPPVPTVEFPAPTVAEEPNLSSERNIPMPAAKKMVKMPSLKDLKAQVNNPVTATKANSFDVSEEIQTSPGRDINPDLFQVVWRELTNQKKAEDKTSEYMILNRPVSLNENLEVILQVENPVQISQFDAIRADFMADLRRRLGNNRVNVKLEVKEQNTGRNLYTSQDKFSYLSEKYPILPELKKRLGLDTDF